MERSGRWSCHAQTEGAAVETDHPREVVEAALAHMVQNKVEPAYRCSDLFERRRGPMEDWAANLSGEDAEGVVAGSMC